MDPLSHWNKEENRQSSKVLKPFIILQPISWLLCPAGPSNLIQESFIICCTDQWGPLQRTLSFPWLQVKRLLPNLQNISLRVVFIGFFFYFQRAEGSSTISERSYFPLSAMKAAFSVYMCKNSERVCWYKVLATKTQISIIWILTSFHLLHCIFEWMIHEDVLQDVFKTLKHGPVNLKPISIVNFHWVLLHHRKKPNKKPHQ